jgi:hypothetical protein
VTYLQNWEPLEYQAGKLAKTVTLAPKETKKYSKKTTFHRKRAEKEIELHARTRRDESSQTSRAEQEIVRKALVSTNFELQAQGTYKLPIAEGTEPQLSLEKINAERVAIVVSPGSKMDSVDSIEQVVILRGGQTHRPTKADVVPTTLQNRMGATVEATKGAFYFPVELFNPDMPITVVLVGKKGNLEWTMPQDELRMLK